MRNIIKRDGTVRPYEPEKIITAMGKAFRETAAGTSREEMERLLRAVEKEMEHKDGGWAVEDIQDAVERVLMENGRYEEAKRYILYRHRRNEQRAARRAMAQAAGVPALDGVLAKIEKDFPGEAYALTVLNTKFQSFVKPGMGADAALEALVKAAVELTSQEAPRWEFIAARLLNARFGRSLEEQLRKRGIGGLYDKLRRLTDEGLYGEYILAHYSREEIEQAQNFLRPERDELFTYSGLDLLLKRYVIHDRAHAPLETPQEMFLGIALHLAMREKRDRMAWVQKFYDMLSRMHVTMATPTLSNARKPYHQLSSCFIDTVPDSLEGIYRSIDNFAQVSKYGGGMGMYFGKVRAAGGSIRGFEGAAGGVVRWIRLVNDTAVAVDQLGMRQGAVAVYLDAWHKDLPEFLQLRTNNGDDRMKAHDVFPAVCYPDLFWKMAKEDLNATWYLMCPHEIHKIKGYHLEDFYGEEWEERYFDCVQDPRVPKRTMVLKDLVRLILKSAVETGTPFTFNRDHVNRMNPNAHAGMIYCSNLCTEIAQNMKALKLEESRIVEIDGESVVVNESKPGDFVVCNLASLSLGNIDVNNEEELSHIIHVIVRALDNVIDLNYYPIPYAKITNRKYRPIGLGVSGYHHMLVKQNLRFESEEHLQFADTLFEKINYYAIQASTALAREKGSYSMFAGSDWQSGAYFTKRGYTSDAWSRLFRQVREQGMRNAWLMAIAPTSSTSIIAGTTAGVDPIMNKYFLEEKKGSMIARVAPDLDARTFWLYKNAHLIDQEWVVRSAGIRQRHIDQAQSVNLYITNEFTLRQVLMLYIHAWEYGVKTIYYVRSKSLEVEECESCAS